MKYTRILSRISPEVRSWLANQQGNRNADYITARAKELLAEDGERLRLLRARRLDELAAYRLAEEPVALCDVVRLSERSVVG